MRYQLPYREIIFGLEDSIVSTLGVVVGIAAGTDSRYIVLLSALVVIVVESLSMTAGSYLSNKSELEIICARRGLEVKKKEKAFLLESLIDSLFMLVSYITGGIISVLPFFLLPPQSAILPAIVLSVASLFGIGFIKGRYVKVNALRSGLEMSLVSFFAAGLGYLVGKLASTYLI